MFRHRCLNGVATADIHIMHKQQCFDQENMIMLSRPCGREPRHYVLVPVGRIKLPDPSVRMGGYLGLLVPSVIQQSSPAFLKVEN